MSAMKNFLTKFDDLAGLHGLGFVKRNAGRVAFAFMVIMAAAAPHSIAATQIAWGIGLVASLIFLAASPRSRPSFKWIDAALWAFFLWAVISGFFSYEPAVSLDRLRGVILFTIVYFVVWNIRNLRSAFLVAFMLIVSSMVNVVWTPIERMLGRGIEIQGTRTDGPLGKALIYDGDTLLKADGKKLFTPDDLLSALDKNESVSLLSYRPDFEFVVKVKRADLLGGDDALARLGIQSWKKSHNWRSMGFYNHYTTYAEVLQLIASLTFGLLIAAIRSNRKTFAAEPTNLLGRVFTSNLFLAIALGGLCLALLMTVTRASQLAFMISAFVIVLLTASRRFLLAAVVIAIPVVIGGLIVLQNSRQVGFFDAKDDSTKYRFMMWNDGARIFTANARHMIVGVGMDSVQRHWQEWQMYDGGRAPMGHFHSTPIQLAVERGLPALLLWLLILAIYARTLWYGIKHARDGDWRSFGILIGCAGGAIGFFASGIVHYNLGDAEVAMVFYMLMALGLKTSELTRNNMETV